MVKKRDVRGISKITLVILVLLIILILAAYVVIKNVVLKGSGERTLGKFTLDLEISQVQVIQNNSLNVVVRRNKGAGEFSAINFIMNNGTTKESIFVNVSMGELESKSFILHLLDLNATEIKKVSVDAIFKSESEKEYGENIKDEYIMGSFNQNSNSNHVTCIPSCYEEAQCGDDGCGGECGMGCSVGYNCSGIKCIPTLETKCLLANVSITIASHSGTNFTIKLFRTVGEGEISGVKLVFSNDSKSSNFVVDEPGNIAVYENVTRYVTISQDYLTNITKARNIVYFIGERGIQDFCDPSRLVYF